MLLDERDEKPICPICGTDMLHRFTAPYDYRKPSTSTSYKVYWCHACDFGNVWKKPTPAEVETFYQLDDYYTHGNKQLSEESSDNMTFFDRIRVHISWELDNGKVLNPSEVKDYLPDNKKKTICEIGCGNGSNLSEFFSDGFDVVGVEPDKAARDVATQTIDKVFDGTAENLPAAVKEQKFDVVLMSHVLEHCLDINKAVSNVYDILIDGGVFVLETPNCKSMGFDAYQAEWPWSDIPRHLNFFTPSSLERILKKHGFKVKYKAYRGFCRQFDNSWLKMEEEIWNALNTERNIVKPNFKNRSWKLLLRSLFASKARKYDSVRIIAIK